MTRTTKPAPTAAATEAKPAKAGKVAKLDKAAKAAPATEAKPAKAKAEGGERTPRRSAMHGQRITVTEAGKAGKARGNAAILLAAITAHKTTDAALGTEYQREGGKYDGETWRVLPVDIAYLAKRGLIELS